MAPNHELFGRVVSVTIGPPGQQGRVWSGLRTRFHVHKTGESAPNKLKLTIYNLSADSRHYIENGGRYNGSGTAYAVQVSAGYAGDSRLIYSGHLDLGSSHTLGRHNSFHEGSDWVTDVHSMDGGHIARAVVLSHSFGPKTSDDTIIHYVANAMGITLGSLKGIGSHKSNHGRALTGSAAMEMDRLCRSRGLRWSIQDGVLQILPYGQSADPTAIILSQATGMVGSPEKTERGIKIVSLLRGDINPGRLIQVQSTDINGNYAVEDVVHEGDTHDQPWYSTIEAIPVAG